jgi:hypothetical protein
MRRKRNGANRQRDARQGGETKVWRDPRITGAGQRQDAESEPENNGDGDQPEEPTRRTRPRIIAGPGGPTDPRELECERLLERVLLAEGRPSITKAVGLYTEAGFEFPAAQPVWLQLLEHRDEERIVEAIERLTEIFEEEEPERRQVLESRLRRIEEFADEPATQKSASELRRLLSSL